MSVSGQCLQGQYRETGFKFALPLGQFIGESNPSYFQSLRETLGKRSSLTSPNIRKLEKKSKYCGSVSAVTNKLNVKKQVTTFKF